MMPRKHRDERFMGVALAEARRALGQTSPNPAVGAVLVVGNRIVARGHHRRAGAAHAEVECLHHFGQRIPKSATMYVTLEPCSTTGRTGPCTNVLIEAGLTKIVIGAVDPNPRHAGRGIELLTKAGLEVHTGVLAAECSELNEAFNKWIQTGRPFVIAKCGMSLDGRLTAAPSEGRWLTSSASRRHAHQLRAQVDAILVGAGTVRADNPQLTVRGVPAARQPWRVVLSRSGTLPSKARLFTDRFVDRTLVFRQIELNVLLGELGAKEITSVLLEGGGRTLGEALDGKLIDKVQVYAAPILSGGPVVAFAGNGVNSTAEAPRLDRVRYEKIGQDICVTGYPTYGQAAPE